MTNGDADHTLDRTDGARSRRSTIVLVLVFLVWAAIVVGYGAYLLRTVVQSGVEAVPLGPTLIVTAVIVAIPWLHWRLSRDASAPSDGVAEQ